MTGERFLASLRDCSLRAFVTGRVVWVYKVRYILKQQDHSR